MVSASVRSWGDILKELAFVISAVTCGIAGALVAQQNQNINSDFITFNLSIFLLLIVLFGGPSIVGPAVGAIVLTLLDAFLARWPGLQHFTYDTLLLFALYAMPQGLAGKLQHWGRRLWPALYRTPTLPNVDGEWRPRHAMERDASGVMLEAQGLYKAYGGVVPTRDVSFALRPGHVHALIGPNGAGKTTLLNILSGIVTPDRGSIRFLGRDITQQRASGIGRTFQNLKLFPHMRACWTTYWWACTHTSPWASGPVCSVCQPRAARSARRAWKRCCCCSSSDSMPAPTTKRQAFPMACSVAWSWRGRWPPIHACCCSTSPRRASIRRKRRR